MNFSSFFIKDLLSLSELRIHTYLCQSKFCCCSIVIRVVFIAQLLCAILGRLGIRPGLLSVLFSYARIGDTEGVTVTVRVNNISCKLQFVSNSQILPNSTL
jgi:hypothetical protein